MSICFTPPVFRSSTVSTSLSLALPLFLYLSLFLSFFSLLFSRTLLERAWLRMAQTFRGGLVLDIIGKPPDKRKIQPALLATIQG